jgi:hypothetical protein
MTTKQKNNKTQPRRPANPPARFAFRQKKQRSRQAKGQEPKHKQKHTHDLPKDTAVKCHCVISQKQANKSKLIRCHLEVKQGRRSAIKASSSYAANNTEWQKIKPLGVLSVVLVHEAMTVPDRGIQQLKPEKRLQW